MGPKRVLFIVPSLPVGGSELFVLNLIHGLDSQRVFPVLLSLGSPEDPVYLRVRENIRKYIHRRRWRYDLTPADAIRAIMRERAIDSVFCLGFFSYVFVRAALKRMHGDPRIIISLHSTKPRDLKSFVQDFIIVRTLTGGEEIVTVSNNQRAYLQRLFRIKSAQLSTIHNGVDTRHWGPPPASFNPLEMRRSLGITEDAVVITNVAELRPEKRHDIMIRALQSLVERSERKDIILLLVGSDPGGQAEWVFTLAKQAGVAGRVIYAGLQQDVRPYLWISDLFTLGSTSVETLSLAALEAMATGLPCVLTDIGGANEMITDGENGYLVKPGSSEELARGWEMCIRQRSNFDHRGIRKRIEKEFGLDRCVEQYQEMMLRE